MVGRVPIVYIVDDDETTLRYFEAVLSDAGLTCQLVGSAQEFLETYDPSQPGCLLLDVRLPGMSGTELQERLNQMGAVIPVLFVSAHADVAMVVQAMKAGAFGFLEKPVANDALLSQVRAALRTDDENRSSLREREQMLQRFGTLTPRERDVLSLLMAGSSNKLMATDLNLSQRTVELYRARIMDKMGSRSLAQLIRMAIELGYSPAGRPRSASH